VGKRAVKSFKTMKKMMWNEYITMVVTTDYNGGDNSECSFAAIQ